MASNVSDFIGGWIGGCLGIFIGQPFDTIKVRQQAHQNSSILFQTKELFFKEGWRNFYRGMTFPLLFSGVQNSLFFGFYGLAQDLYQNDGNKYLKSFYCGCFGGVGQLIVSCPVDLIKIRMQIQKDNNVYTGSFNAAKTIYAQSGFRGLYHGIGIVTLRDVYSSGLYICSYTWLVDKLPIQSEALKTFIGGGIAGWFSWVSIIPFDVVKSRIQADCQVFSKYDGIAHCFSEVYKEGGLKAFGRGFLAVSFRSFPVNGATFLGYEYTLKLCHYIRNYFEDSSVQIK